MEITVSRRMLLRKGRGSNPSGRLPKNTSIPGSSSCICLLMVATESWPLDHTSAGKVWVSCQIECQEAMEGRLPRSTLPRTPEHGTSGQGPNLEKLAHEIGTDAICGPEAA
eukprot:6405742-Prymnesium_polylepis.1